MRTAVCAIVAIGRTNSDHSNAAATARFRISLFFIAIPPEKYESIIVYISTEQQSQFGPLQIVQNPYHWSGAFVVVAPAKSL
jgi:hypothetical protein